MNIKVLGGNRIAFRYRKSINLGGGFRVNLSKSGIGYSWGVKGYRVTKTVKGTTRRTASVPENELSWVDETKNNKNKNSNINVKPKLQDIIDNNIYDTEDINNDISSNMVSEGMEEMLTFISYFSNYFKSFCENKRCN